MFITFDILIMADRFIKSKVVVWRGPATVAETHVEATDRRFGGLPSAAETLEMKQIWKNLTHTSFNLSVRNVHAKNHENR